MVGARRVERHEDDVGRSRRGGREIRHRRVERGRRERLPPHHEGDRGGGQLEAEAQAVSPEGEPHDPVHRHAGERQPDEQEDQGQCARLRLREIGLHLRHAGLPERGGGGRQEHELDEGKRAAALAAGHHAAEQNGERGEDGEEKLGPHAGRLVDPQQTVDARHAERQDGRARGRAEEQPEEGAARGPEQQVPAEDGERGRQRDGATESPVRRPLDEPPDAARHEPEARGARKLRDEHGLRFPLHPRLCPFASKPCKTRSHCRAATRG